MSKILHIFIAPERGAAMQSLDQCAAIAGAGLSGDRYEQPEVRRNSAGEVTLIEIEQIEAFRAATGYPLAPDGPRRNLVTRGARLNDLCGRRFYIGPVLVEAFELAEPCSLFRRRTHAEALRFFAGRGGLRARILTGGIVSVEDAIRAEDETTQD
jgi:MOSC domain-containing protein YiiM